MKIRMKIRVAVAVALAAVSAGCGSQLTVSRPPVGRANRGQRYRLYAHCGIQWTMIDGVFWRATRPLSDGNGNPPAGWGNPFEEGMLTVRNRTTVEFSSPAGTITFKRTRRTRPPVICS